MEVSNENFTIAVDSKKFVADPEAKLSLDGAMAFLSYILHTGEHEKANSMLCQLLTMMMHEYRGAKPKTDGWGDKKKGW